MATVTILPGDTEIFDPSDKRTVVFDFDAFNLAVGVQLTSYLFTITSLVQTGVTALTKDNEQLLAGNRKVQARFLATTATRGDRYQISVKGVTNELPVQEKEYSINVLVEDR